MLTQQRMTHDPLKSTQERFLHALGFEVLALLMCAPLLAWVFEYPLAHVGALSLMVSLVAMLWNMAFNALFDVAQKRRGFARTAGVRVVHAVLFELGMIAAVVPLAAWWLSIGLWAAFVLDIGLVLFFLPYTLGYNWLYDILRAKWLARRRVARLNG